MEKTYTLEEIAQYFHVTRQTIVNYINSNLLVAVKLPTGTVVVEETSFEDFKNKYRTEVK